MRLISAVVNDHLAWQTQHTTIDVRLLICAAVKVNSRRAAQHRYAVGVILKHFGRQCHRVGQVIGRVVCCYTFMITRVVVSVNFEWSRVLLIREVHVVLRPRDRGESLPDSSGPDFGLVSQSIRPTGIVVELLVNGPVRRGLLTPRIVTGYAK